MGVFGAAHRCEGWAGGGGGEREAGKKVSLPKICHTYPTLTKLGTAIPYLKKIPKNM